MKKFKKVFDTFCYISTLVFLFSAIYCMIFWGNSVQLNLSYVWGVLGISVVDSILYIFLEAENETSKLKVIFFRIIYFLIANANVLIVGFYLEWFEISNKQMVIGIEIVFLIIYLIITLIEYLRNAKTAELMNKILKSRKEIEH